MKRYWSEETYVVGDEKEKSSEMEYDVGCMRKLFRDSLPDGYYETFDDSITLHRINSWISDNDEYEENSFRPVVVLNHNIAIMVGDEYYDGSTPERNACKYVFNSFNSDLLQLFKISLMHFVFSSIVNPLRAFPWTSLHPYSMP